MSSRVVRTFIGKGRGDDIPHAQGAAIRDWEENILAAKYEIPPEVPLKVEIFYLYGGFVAYEVHVSADLPYKFE